jgi:perosamine synthetase
VSKTAIRTWLKQHQHVPLVRVALDTAEIGYEIARAVCARNSAPAIAGGWPTRRVPFPAPKPFAGHERGEMRRLMRHQSATFDGGTVVRFERELAARFESRHAIATSSGTGALHAAMAALDLRPGDEVIVPVLTYVSTALAVVYQGATPRFADVDPSTWNIDPARVEELVTPRTKAIVVVHLGGVPCDMDAIDAIAARHGLVVVEDAAQAHGARWGGRCAGTLGRIGCFSFQSAKTLTTGEGGAVLTQDDELARRVRLAMSMGESPSRGRAPRTDEASIWNAWDYDTIGWNYRMSPVQAALGLGQLARFDAIRAAHERNAQQLERELGGIDGVRLRVHPTRAEVCRSSFFVRLDPGVGLLGRDELAAALAKERIDFRLPYARPLTALPVFDARGSFPVAEAVCRDAIGFRVDPSLRPREMSAIGFAMRRLCAWSRAREHEPMPSATRAERL